MAPPGAHSPYGRLPPLALGRSTLTLTLTLTLSLTTTTTLALSLSLPLTLTLTLTQPHMPMLGTKLSEKVSTKKTSHSSHLVRFGLGLG